MRLRADVPIGVCLSGGLDSSSIVSILLKNYNLHELNTFSAIYKIGANGDESNFINEYKGIIKNMYFTYPTHQSLYDDIEQFIEAHAEPMPTTGPYAQFNVMKLAHKHAVVTLDGQGADEEFAGYHYFFGYYFKDLLRNIRWIRLTSEIWNYLNNHHSLYGIKTFSYFLLPQFIKTQTRVIEKGYIQSEFIEANMEHSTISEELYNSNSLSDALLNHFEYKLENL